MPRRCCSAFCDPDDMPPKVRSGCVPIRPADGGAANFDPCGSVYGTAGGARSKRPGCAAEGCSPIGGCASATKGDEPDDLRSAGSGTAGERSCGPRLSLLASVDSSAREPRQLVFPCGHKLPAAALTVRPPCAVADAKTAAAAGRCCHQRHGATSAPTNTRSSNKDFLRRSILLAAVVSMSKVAKIIALQVMRPCRQLELTRA